MSTTFECDIWHKSHFQRKYANTIQSELQLGKSRAYCVLSNTLIEQILIWSSYINRFFDIHRTLPKWISNFLKNMKGTAPNIRSYVHHLLVQNALLFLLTINTRHGQMKEHKTLQCIHEVTPSNVKGTFSLCLPSTFMRLRSLQNFTVGSRHKVYC